MECIGAGPGLATPLPVCTGGCGGGGGLPSLRPHAAGARDTVNSLPPHIYLVAANAFRKMLRERQSQSLIVNGGCAEPS